LPFTACPRSGADDVGQKRRSLSHYTDWTIGHVISGALGWVGIDRLSALSIT
jgi:cbb3-type cytochrome oxidase subunit 1